MKQLIVAIGALLAASIFIPGDAFARPGGGFRGGGGGFGGGFRGGMGGFRGGVSGFRGPRIGHVGGFRGAGFAVRPGIGRGFHPGWRGHGFRPGIRHVGHHGAWRHAGHHGRWWSGHRRHYGKYYPYYGYGALATGLVGASYYYNDYPYYSTAYPYYSTAYPYYGADPYYGNTYEQTCYLHIRRLPSPKGRIVVRRQYVCS